MAATRSANDFFGRCSSAGAGTERSTSALLGGLDDGESAVPVVADRVAESGRNPVVVVNDGQAHALKLAVDVLVAQLGRFAPFEDAGQVLRGDDTFVGCVVDVGHAGHDHGSAVAAVVLPDRRVDELLGFPGPWAAFALLVEGCADVEVAGEVDVGSVLGVDVGPGLNELCGHVVGSLFSSASMVGQGWGMNATHSSVR